MLFQPIRIDLGPTAEARLVVHEGLLLGVLVHLSEDYKEIGMQGRWFLEVGFGLHDVKGIVFDNLDDARDWFEEPARRN